MMDILLLGMATAVAAGLTLFSGFGLGTLLLPVFALSVPMPAAVALTAYGVSKETFLGTGIVIACLVDTVRLAVYGGRVMDEVTAHGPLVAVAVASAFAGVWVGARLLPRVAMPAIRRLVAVGLIAIAAGLASGWL